MKVNSSKINIGIIGAGISGMATAICLAKKGYIITLFDPKFGSDKKASYSRPHIYLNPFVNIIEKLFPNILAAALEMGAHKYSLADLLENLKINNEVDYIPHDEDENSRFLCVNRKIVEQLFEKQISNTDDIKVIKEKVIDFQEQEDKFKVNSQFKFDYIINTTQLFNSHKKFGPKFENITLFFEYDDTTPKSLRNLKYIDTTFGQAGIYPAENLKGSISLTTKKLSKIDSKEKFLKVIFENKDLTKYKKYLKFEDQIYICRNLSNSICINNKKESHKFFNLGNAILIENPENGRGLSYAMMEVENLDKVFPHKALYTNFVNNYIIPEWKKALVKDKHPFIMKLLKYLISPIIKNDADMFRKFFKVFQLQSNVFNVINLPLIKSIIDSIFKIRLIETFHILSIPIFSLIIAAKNDVLNLYNENLIIFILAMFFQILSSFCINDLVDYKNDLKNPRMSLNNYRSKGFLYFAFFSTLSLSMYFSYNLNKSFFGLISWMNLLSFAYSSRIIRLKETSYFPPLIHFIMGVLYSLSYIFVYNKYTQSNIFISVIWGFLLASASITNELIDKDIDDSKKSFIKLVGVSNSLNIVFWIQISSLLLFLVYSMSYEYILSTMTILISLILLIVKSFSYSNLEHQFHFIKLRNYYRKVFSLVFLIVLVEGLL